MSLRGDSSLAWKDTHTVNSMIQHYIRRLIISLYSSIITINEELPEGVFLTNRGSQEVGSCRGSMLSHGPDNLYMYFIYKTKEFFFF